MKKPLEKIPNQTLEQLSALFVKYGYRSISMLDIATELAISKKTLYQYVNNKEDLILNVFQYQVKPIEEKLLNISQNSTIEYEQKMNEIALLLVDFYRIVHYKCVLDADKFYPRVYQECQSFQENVLMNTLVQTTKEAKQGGIVKNEVDCTLVTTFFFQLMESIFYTLNFIPYENQIDKVKSVLQYHLNSILI